MKDCRAFRAALRPLLEGELAIERTLELEQHASSCRSCGAELERARALERALLALAPAPLERLDLERNVQAVLARLDAPALPRARPRLLRHAPWAAAAAALAALAGWRFLGPAPLQPAPQVPLAQAPAAEPALDPARLESARAEVFGALRECQPGFDPALDDAREFAGQVDARTAELARAGWPRVALVQSAASEADTALAARGLRWLGAHAEGASRLRAALARPELAASALALALDLGPAGIDELRRAPETAALRTIVLARLARGAQPLLSPWIEDTLARGRSAPEERAQLLDALAACGADGLQALLRLASRGTLDRALALERCATIPDAARALGELLEGGRQSGVDERVLLGAVAELGADSGWEWVERAAREGRHEEEALRALARGTPEALAVLLHLRAASGTDALEVARTLEQVLREHPDSAAALVPRGTRAEIAGLFEIASGAPEAALVPSLVELAGHESLPEPDRRWALVLVAEQGRPEHLARLAALYPRLRERTLQAACLIALHSLGGADALDAALERRSALVRRRVRALLDDPANANRNATTLARLVRAIENTLPEPQS